MNYSDEDKTALKYLVECAGLFIQASGIDPNVVSDWGRAIRIDLEKGVVKFKRYEIIKRRTGGERAGLSDCFLRTEMPIDKMQFELIRNYCQDDGSWNEYEMDLFKGNSWTLLRIHVLENINNKRPIVQLKKWILGKWKKFYTFA